MSRSSIKYQIVKKDDTLYYLSSKNTQDYQNIPKKEPCIGAVQTILIISIYFVLSIGLTFYQKWLFKTYGFNFPLGAVTCHLIVKFALSALIRCIRLCYKGPQYHVKLTWQSIICSLAPPGIASGFDVALSNWSIALITISLYTMTKSSTIVFILGFSLIFKLEKKSWSLIAIVATISGGLFMFTYKSTQFHVLGFILCLLASFSSGLRWTMAQVIMQKSKLGLQNPIDMIYYMQPWMLLPVIPITLWFEGPEMYNNLKSINWNNSEPIMLTVAAVNSGAILAFVMEITEFLVVTYTSSLTLSVTGIFKEICILILAFEWKGDHISGLNFVGLLLCLGGIILHVIQKVLLNRSKVIESLELSDNSLPSNSSKKEDGIDANLPLLTQKSSSLINLLTTDFTSDEEDDIKMKENSSQVLSNILQRRE
ncbi:solute carrier family 35 member C2-like isoform X1 [Vespa mandarinia]|uniref:solute carrier family 35 member C2-like isoform X1 n=1 Tax=Vespa mandarinia TaxID=7446 RepID=UPI00161ACF37|nr:solute carrier family 35 member C2-like isoform X1 [Vespa mandarinia]